MISYRYDDIYELVVEYKDGTGKGGFRETKFSESVTKLFDENGTLREDLFLPRVKQLCVSLQSDKKQN